MRWTACAPISCADKLALHSVVGRTFRAVELKVIGTASVAGRLFWRGVDKVDADGTSSLPPNVRWRAHVVHELGRVGKRTRNIREKRTASPPRWASYGHPRDFIRFWVPLCAGRARGRVRLNEGLSFASRAFPRGAFPDSHEDIRVGVRIRLLCVQRSTRTPPGSVCPHLDGEGGCARPCIYREP